MPDQPKASIIILTYNNLELTQACLESVYSRTEFPFEVIVVDNASQDGIPQVLKEFASNRANFRFILNRTNQGFSRANNQGASLATGEYLIFLNNDTVVTSGWLPALLNHLQDPKVGMVGPVTNTAANESRIPVTYQTLTAMPDFALSYTRAHQGQTIEIEMLAFFCVALRRSVFEEIGPLDEQFDVGMFEDEDYALRLKQRGYRLLCAEDVFIHHQGSASFSKLSLPRYWYLFDQNRKKFEQKWGIRWRPQLYRREDVREQVSELVDQASWHVSLITELQGQLTQIQNKNQELEQTLRDIYSSEAWKLALFFRRLRLWLAPKGSRREWILKKLKQTLGSAVGFLLKPLNWISRLFHRLGARQMSWYAYAFDRYKRQRSQIFPPGLSAIRCPSQKGLVSIVLPVYNGAVYLSEALESILRQTYPDFELIIVDDGSTDQTPQIIASFVARDKRLRVIHQENQRLPGALTNGFSQARGEFLTWTSADNRLKPDYLEKMVACLRAHPTWDMVYGDEEIIAEDGQPLRDSPWYLHYQTPPGSEHIRFPANPAELNTYPNNYIGGAFLYRDRASFLLRAYSPWRFGMEDYDYWMRMNTFLTIRHADGSFYEYRFHSSSLTSQDEELGITRKRARLMNIEDFRRDFCLTPMLWWVETAPASPGAKDPVVLALSDKIRQWIHKTGQICIDSNPGVPSGTAIPDDTKAMNLPDYGCPLVYLWVTDQPGEGIEPPQDWAVEGWRVLVTTCKDGLSSQVSSSWDACITIANLAQPPSTQWPRQGWLSIPDVQTLCKAVDIQARDAYLSRLENLAESPCGSRYKISVIICTYHRGEMLRNSIRSVAEQSFPAEDYELIVVNNDPADLEVDKIVEQIRNSDFSSRPDRIKLVHCPMRGLSYARNAGITEANGEVVCFIDDDALAKPDWINQMWLAFEQNPNAGVIGGAIELVKPRPKWAKPGWEKYWSGFEPGYSHTTIVQNWWEYPWGANWGARRKALFEIGGFRTRYGRRGSDFGGGEELIAAVCIQRLGFEILVNPNALVIHAPEASRFTLSHVWRTIWAGKRTEYRLQTDLYLPMGLGMRNIFRSMIRNLSKSIFSRLAPYQRLEQLLFFLTGFGSIVFYCSDRLKRFCKPITLRG